MKIITLLLFFAVNFSAGQKCTYIINDSIQIQTNEYLAKYINNTVYELDRYNINPSNVFKDIRVIDFQLMSDNFFGYSVLIMKTIFINVKIPYYLPSLYETVILHEIGHFIFTDSHNEKGVYILQEGGKIDIESLIRHYPFYKKQFFQHLKNYFNITK